MDAVAISRRPMVMFDIGGVLLKLDYGAFYAAAHERFGVDATEFKKGYAILERKDLLGEITSDEFFAGMRSLLRAERVEERALRDMMSLSWVSPIPEMLDLKESLIERGYEVGLLSNIGAICLEDLAARYPQILTISWNGPRVYSFEHGCMKPDERFYHLAERGYHMVYIDDKSSYIETAARLGWKGIHYTRHVDPTEAIRSFAGHNEQSSADMIVAGSIDQVVSALERFDVVLR
jgi:FMN phosphatase YigB (HAD superfamily)